MKKEDCPKMKAVDKLVERLEAHEIPDGYEPGDWYYNQILAEIRHEYTNYDELLWELPDCPDCPEEVRGECEGVYLSHDALKWEAKNLAHSIYQEWLKAREQ